MSEKLYARCPICKGTLRYPIPDGAPRMPSSDCLCSRGKTPGWVLVGVTMAQLERMADLERALAGDPGLPTERREKALQRAREGLRRAEMKEWR